MKKIFFILIIGVVITACTNISEEENAVDQTFPDHESWNSTIYLTKNGLKNAIIIAGHLTKYNDSQVTTMDQGVDIDFFNARGVKNSHMTSLKADVNEQTNNLVAQGNVVVVSDSSATLYTEELEWNNEREKIISRAEVTFITNQDTLYGTGFESDANLENWVMEKISGVTNRELDGQNE